MDKNKIWLKAKMLRAETEKQQSRKKQFDGGDDDDECDDDEILIGEF